MSEDWDRLAQAIHDRRIELGLSRQRVASTAGVSLGSVKNLEKKGRSYERTPPSLALVAEALGWTRESPRTVLAGGDPKLADDPRREESGGRYVRVYIDDVDEIIRDVVRGVVVKVAPKAPLSEVIEAEELVLRILQEHGLLDADAGKPRSDEAEHS